MRGVLRPGALGAGLWSVEGTSIRQTAAYFMFYVSTLANQVNEQWTAPQERTHLNAVTEQTTRVPHNSRGGSAPRRGVVPQL